MNKKIVQKIKAFSPLTLFLVPQVVLATREGEYFEPFFIGFYFFVYFFILLVCIAGWKHYRKRKDEFAYTFPLVAFVITFFFIYYFSPVFF